MSNHDYQLAMADLIRRPDLCHSINSGIAEVLERYSLTPVESERLRTVARHRGMAVNCMLYRANRLVGITRRLPATVELLGSKFRETFNLYLIACPDAKAEFDDEAFCFARFVSSLLNAPSSDFNLPTEPLRTVLFAEISRLSS